MGVSENRGTPKSSILIEFSIINHPFWGTPIFGNPHIGPFKSKWKGDTLTRPGLHDLFVSHSPFWEKHPSSHGKKPDENDRFDPYKIDAAHTMAMAFWLKENNGPLRFDMLQSMVFHLMKHVFQHSRIQQRSSFWKGWPGSNPLFGMTFETINPTPSKRVWILRDSVQIKTL